MIGKTLSHYTILEEISRGGMGIVYRAVDVKLNREVALKVLPPELVADPERKRRFTQEAQAAAALEHPHIAVVYEIDEADGVTFIAMELIRGERLKDVLEKDRLTLARSLELATEVAEALARAHDKGIVHRDLKPANIMVTDEGHAKIIDFGLAKLLEPLGTKGSEVETALREETRAGQVLGSVPYMSPEQASGAQVDHRTDIFSFGTVLYEMLAGRHPFPGPTGVDILHGILREPTPRLPSSGADVSTEAGSHLQHIVDKCLAKDPAARYTSMKELVCELRELREEIGVTAQPLRKSPRPWGAAFGIALVAILMSWLLMVRDDRPPGIGASGRPAIAVMYFESLSGDEEIRWLSKGLPTMLLTDLSQTPGLDVVSSERVHEILKQVGEEDLESIDKSLVSEVARRAGAGAVVVGSIFKSGPEIRIDVQVEDVGSGRLLSAESVRGEDVFPLVDELTGRIRASLELGDQPAVRPIAEVTTPSLEAFRLYSQGLEARRNTRYIDARSHFEAAVKVDPSFAMAYFQLSQMTIPALSVQYRRKVLENIDRLPERQRLLVDATYTNEVDKNPQRAVELLESLVARYPDEEDAHHRLAIIYWQLGQPQKTLSAYERGVTAVPGSGLLHNFYGYQLLDAGRYPEAFRELETYARLYPDEPNPHDSLAEAYLITGQPESALQHYARALELDSDWSHDGPAWAYGMLGRYDEALDEREKQTDLTIRQDVAADTGCFVTAFMLSRVGRYREAKEQIGQGLAGAVRRELAYMQFAYETLSALLALETHDYSEALKRIKRAEKPIPLLNQLERRGTKLLSDLLAGVAEARSGRLEAARDRLEVEARLYDKNTQWENWFYHALEGEIALAAGDLATAESAFSAGEPEFKMWFNMGPNSSAPTVAANCLPLRDGRARVMRARGDLQGAIEFYRSLNRPDIRNKWTALLEPRYVLEVARLLDGTGDTEGARSEYQRFLELWKDADPELPELAEAKQYLVKEFP